MAYILSFFLIFCIYFQCFSSIPLQFSFFEPVPCAKYSCIEKKESCAQSKIIEGKIEVTLSPICKENEKYDVGGDPNTIFYEGKEITGECKPSIISETRYPGEDCSKDEDASTLQKILDLVNVISQYKNALELVFMKNVLLLKIAWQDYIAQQFLIVVNIKNQNIKNAFLLLSVKTNFCAIRINVRIFYISFLLGQT